MSKNRVIVLGAGFSVPAGIPTQQKLLNEIMGAVETKDFLDDESVFSKKYLHSFIRIGIFLLENYSILNVNEIKSQYQAILDFEKKAKVQIDYIKGIISYLETKYFIDLEHQEDLKNLSQESVEIYDEIMQKLVKDKTENEAYDVNYVIKLIELKRVISEEMKKANLQVDLEDVFTNFDKSIKHKENLGQYNYIEIERLRNDLLKIFIFHFAGASKSFDGDSYKNFIESIKDKKNISIISLNWDLVLEQLFKENGINYDSCLAKSYWCSDSNNNSKRGNKNVCLYKMHGSINWLKCHSCGKINIIKKINLQETSLFDDAKENKCLSCKVCDKESETLLQAEIITPTMIKAIENQLYQNIWAGASRAIANADEILFIGYSLPSADFDFRYLLKNNVSKNCKIKVILAPGDKPKKSNEFFCVETRYRKLFFNIVENMSFDYKGVEEAEFAFNA